MLSFENDYSEGAHEKILQRFLETNYEQTVGYGLDPYTASAKEKIKAACQCLEAQVYFLAGGTQTNRIVIDTILQKYEGVLAATSGHISIHEAGAIEASGHKVLQLPAKDGKISGEVVETYVKNFYADGTWEHMVAPGMVYISHPTEYGTLYSKEELQQLSQVCRTYHLPLYVDGARLGYGLMSSQTDVTLADLAELCDVFYIGGTKVGALCGEAVVFTKHNMPAHFMTSVKQNGALMAKGRVIGLQFDTLFTDGLYFKISRHAIEMAELLKAGLTEKGYSFFLDSPTNQQFVILQNDQMEVLSKTVRFSVWEPYDDQHTVVRFATSWATTREQVEQLLAML